MCLPAGPLEGSVGRGVGRAALPSLTPPGKMSLFLLSDHDCFILQGEVMV